MIDVAQKYIPQLEELMVDTWYDDRYKFYHPSNRRVLFKLEDVDNARSFAIIDNGAHRVIGFVNYWFDMDTNSVCGLNIINFSKQIVLFGRELGQIIDDIFCRFNFNRLEFFVIRGNPIEKSYDRLILKYGGRIIGTKTASVRLIDGMLYDEKLYEIMREDYIKAKSRKG